MWVTRTGKIYILNTWSTKNSWLQWDSAASKSALHPAVWRAWRGDKPTNPERILLPRKKFRSLESPANVGGCGDPPRWQLLRLCQLRFQLFLGSSKRENPGHRQSKLHHQVRSNDFFHIPRFPSFAHEVAHGLGLAHDQLATPNRNAINNYSKGYLDVKLGHFSRNLVWCLFSRGGFHTIMAYSRHGEKRINYYSSPWKQHFSPRVGIDPYCDFCKALPPPRPRVFIPSGHLWTTTLDIWEKFALPPQQLETSRLFAQQWWDRPVELDPWRSFINEGREIGERSRGYRSLSTLHQSSGGGWFLVCCRWRIAFIRSLVKDPEKKVKALVKETNQIFKERWVKLYQI